MQPIQEFSVPSSGKTAFQYGLIFGIILAVIEAAIQITSTLITVANMNSSTYPGAMGAQTGVSLVLGIGGFLLSLAAYFVAGIMASNKTGKVSTGTLAGLWAGLFYGVVGFVIGMIVLFAIVLPKMTDLGSATGDMSSSSYEVVRTAAIVGGVIGAVFGIAIALGIGAGMGALGGLVGRSSSKVAPRGDAVYPHYPPYQAQPQPYPVQGQPLPEQSYPAQPYPGQPTPYTSYPQQPYADQPYPPAQPPYPYPSDGGQYPPNTPSVPPTQVARPDQPYNPYE